MLDSNTFQHNLNSFNPTAFKSKSPLDFNLGHAGQIVAHSSDVIDLNGNRSATQVSKAIAFVDGALPDYQSLAAGFKPGTEVHILNPHGNEIQQISQVLAEQTNIQSLAIISHGSDGSLQLGNLNLDTSDLGNYSSELQAWSKSLATGADLLLYGCNVAASDSGKAFVQEIHQFTGADIAASIDSTGNGTGANWRLEYHTGSIETPDLLQSSAETAYTHLLKTFTVRNTNDSGAGSLRQAILDANATPGNDTINFKLTGSQIIQLTSGELDITDNLTITGTGAANLTISGGNSSRIFTIEPTTVNISGLTLANGRASDVGGAIVDLGNLTLTNVALKDNHAKDLGGAIITGDSAKLTLNGSTLSDNSTAATSGGGIFNQGVLVVNGSSFLNNHAIADGGGIFSSAISTVTIANSTFTGNTTHNEGGGIFSKGTLTVTNSNFNNNSAHLGGGISNNTLSGGVGKMTVTGSAFSKDTATSGGAIRTTGTANISKSTFDSNSTITTPGSIIRGGGVFNTGTLTVADSTFSNNISEGFGGGIHSDDPMTITGSTFKGNQAKNTGGGIFTDGSATVNNSTFSGNSAQIGGGISNASDLTMTGNILSGNQASNNGGGILNSIGATLTMTGGKIEQNKATEFGGGIFNDDRSTIAVTGTVINKNTANQGGGIENKKQMTLTNVTITGNQAPNNGGGVFTDGNATIKNSTISGNSSDDGGGIFNENILQLIDSTISSNQASNNGGGVANELTGTMTITGGKIEQNKTTNRGGGIFNDEFSGMAVAGTAINKNSAKIGGGIENKNQATLSNVTLTSNQATLDGGGINNELGGKLTLTSSSVQQNKAANGGGIHNANTTTGQPSIVQVKQSKILQNTATGIGPNLNGTFQSQGGNTIGNATGSTGFANGSNGDVVG